MKGEVLFFTEPNFFSMVSTPKKLGFVQGWVFPVLSCITQRDLLIILHALTFRVFRCCILFPLCRFWARTWAKNFIENSWVAKDGFNAYSELVPSLVTRCSFLHDENFYFFTVLWKKKSVAFLYGKKCLQLFLHALHQSSMI